jgi:hypothetical protein
MSVFDELRERLEKANEPYGLDLAGALAIIAEVEKEHRCSNCSAREGSSHYCLLWTINTPDDHHCCDWEPKP